MKTAFSNVSLSATLLLHAALITAVVTGMSPNPDKRPEQPPIVVQLLPAPVENTPPAPLPVAPAPEPPQPEKKPPEPKKHIARPKPVTKPRETPAPQAPSPAPAPEIPNESKPDTSAVATAPTSAPSTAPAPAAPPAPPAPPAAPAAPARTGVSIPASYAATNRKPDYPAMSRRYEEQGTVVLQVLVKADGTAGEVKLKSSSGHPQLDKSAMSTVQTWRFNPATSEGRPIAEWYQVPIPFKLQN
jgi:protein TonB